MKSDACLRGHRAGTCPHADRSLTKIRRPGRPSKCSRRQSVLMAIPKSEESIFVVASAILLTLYIKASSCDCSKAVPTATEGSAAQLNSYAGQRTFESLDAASPLMPPSAALAGGAKAAITGVSGVPNATPPALQRMPPNPIRLQLQPSAILHPHLSSGHSLVDTAGDFDLQGIENFLDLPVAPAEPLTISPDQLMLATDDVIAAPTILDPAAMPLQMSRTSSHPSFTTLEVNGPQQRSIPNLSLNEGQPQAALLPRDLTTMYTFPAGEATVDNPLTSENLAFLRRHAPQFIQVVSQTSVDAVLGFVAKAEGSCQAPATGVHRCGCGDYCECFCCVAHPFNNRTLRFVLLNKQYMEWLALSEEQSQLVQRELNWQTSQQAAQQMQMQMQLQPQQVQQQYPQPSHQHPSLHNQWAFEQVVRPAERLSLTDVSQQHDLSVVNSLQTMMMPPNINSSFLGSPSRISRATSNDPGVSPFIATTTPWHVSNNTNISPLNVASFSNNIIADLGSIQANSAQPSYEITQPILRLNPTLSLPYVPTPPPRLTSMWEAPAFPIAPSRRFGSTLDIPDDMSVAYSFASSNIGDSTPAKSGGCCGPNDATASAVENTTSNTDTQCATGHNNSKCSCKHTSKDQDLSQPRESEENIHSPSDFYHVRYSANQLDRGDDEASRTESCVCIDCTLPNCPKAACGSQ